MAFKPHVRYLRLVYAKYSELNPEGGRNQFGLAEWTQLIKDCRLLSEDLTTREMRLAFWRCRMVVIDEVRKRREFMTLSWTEFLEALARMALMMTLPSQEDLDELGAENVLAYDRALAKSNSEMHEKIAKRQAEMSSLPLRIDMLCRLLLGRLALLLHGILSAGPKRLSLIKGGYATEDQLRETGL